MRAGLSDARREVNSQESFFLFEKNLGASTPLLCLSVMHVGQVTHAMGEVAGGAMVDGR
jgi:hypothetical protein